MTDSITPLTDTVDAALFLRSKGVENPINLLSSLKDEEVDRLFKLMNGDIVLSGKTFHTEIEKFFLSCPEWTNYNETDKVCLFYQKYQHLKYLKVLRIQKSRLCSIHACVVLQHYLVTIGKNEEDENLGMLDIAKYESSQLRGINMVKFIKDELSIPAEFFFRSVLCQFRRRDSIVTLPLPSPATLPSHNTLCEEIMSRVEYYPALVSNFAVTSVFKARGKVSYSGIPEGDEDDYEKTHAMVLIGMRKTADGNYYMLLQNWWASKPFVEVSSEYLSYCGAKIHFVDPAIVPTMKINQPRELLTMAAAVETECDFAETISEELENN